MIDIGSRASTWLTVPAAERLPARRIDEIVRGQRRISRPRRCAWPVSSARRSVRKWLDTAVSLPGGDSVSCLAIHRPSARSGYGSVSGGSVFFFVRQGLIQRPDDAFQPREIVVDSGCMIA